MKPLNKQNLTDLKALLQIIESEDPETRQTVHYIPSLEISGYGKNEKRAIKMIDESITLYLKQLCLKSTKELGSELRSFGWSTFPRTKREFYSGRDLANKSYSILEATVQTYSDPISNKVQFNVRLERKPNSYLNQEGFEVQNQTGLDTIQFKDNF